MILYEVRRNVRRLRGVELVPRSKIDQHRGFRSIYGFDEDAQEYIVNTGTTAGLHGHNLYSDELLVDFDDEWKAAEQFAEDMAPYSFEMYDTGGRSIHFHVEIDPMYGPHTASIQREWMRKYYPRADDAIYISSGMYRIPGTYHKKKVGARKVLLEDNQGDVLTIGDVREDKGWQPASHYDLDNREELESTLDNLLLIPVREGGRNNRLFWIADLCSKLGESYEAGLYICNQWNNSMCRPPQRSHEVTATVRSAYRKSNEAKG